MRNLEEEIVGPKLGRSEAAMVVAAAANCAKHEDWLGAEIAAKAALANNRRSFYAWALLGVSLARQKDFRLAAEAFRNALTLKPNSIETWVSLGEAYISLLDYKNAALALKRALELDPNAQHASGRRARAIVGRTLAKLSKN
jgi:cytochrome c-type biogenesis protein CcmH/NrfG